QIHIALQIAKGHFRLDHPELRRVASRIGILRAEGGAESVDVGESASEGFAFQLPAHRQIGRFGKKVSRGFVVDIALERRHPKHLSGSFAVTRRDDWGMNVNEIALLKKLV